MRKALLVLGLVGAVMTAGAVAITALFFPSPPERCRVVAQFVTASTAPALHHPTSLAWYDGLLFVADTDGGAVRRYDPDGALVSVWAGFERPMAVAPTPSGVYVADFLTDRITVLNDSGDVTGQWGRHGTGPGEFDAPSGIAVDQRGDVYVADFYNHRVQKFTEGGRFLREWGGRGWWRGRFRYPTGVGITPAGQVLVADGFNHRVQRFTSDGRYLDTFGGTGFGFAGRWPGWFALAKDVAVDRAGNVYVTDAFNGRVQTFTANGSLRAVWGDPRRGDDKLDYASGVAIAPAGHVYVGDFSRSEIWEIACGLTLDDGGFLYVADFYNHWVQKLRNDGSFQKVIGHAGRLGPGVLHYPTGVMMTAQRQLLVADAYNYQLHWFDLEGQALRHVGYHLFWLWPRPVSSSAGFWVATDVASGAGGTIHVADSGNHRVVMLSGNGEYLTEWRIPDADPNIFSPEHVAASPDGSTVYATDLAANRVLVLAVTPPA